MSYRSNMSWYADWESEKEDREDAMAEYARMENQVKIETTQYVVKKTDEPCKLPESPYQQLSLFDMLKPIDYNNINYAEGCNPALNKTDDEKENEEGNSL